MRREQDSRIDLKCPRAIRSDIGGRHGRLDHAIPAQQQAAHLLAGIFRHMRNDLIEGGS